MRVNIIYENNNREFNNCLLLQRELIRRGHDAKIYNKTEDILLRDNTESLTLIPNSYRNGDLDHYRYCFFTNGGIIIVYPCEQVTNHRMPSFFDYSDDNRVKKLPHLCWGQDYYDFIKTLGFDMSFSSVVGALQLDYCRPEFSNFYVSRKLLSKKYQIPYEKKWMLFISDFVLDNDEKYNRLLCSGDVEEHILSLRREHERKTTKEILTWFSRFLNIHKDYILIYRKHPVEILSETIIKFKDSFPNQVYCISEYGIKDWICNADRVITWNSTSAVECFAAKKNIHLLRPYEFDENSGFVEYGFYKDMKRISKYTEFEKSIINDRWSYTSGTIDEINKLYSIEASPTFIRIANAIEDIYKCKTLTEKTPGFRFHRIRYLALKMIPAKILIKKALERIYLLTGHNFGNQSEKGASVNEWMATADNIRDIRRRSELLDEIILRYTSKGKINHGETCN